MLTRKETSAPPRIRVAGMIGAGALLCLLPPVAAMAQQNPAPASPEVNVQEKAPKVTVEQPRPQVTVTQPKPEVTVTQPKPQVTVNQPKPEVTVNQPPPQVQVKEPGAPQIKVEEAHKPGAQQQAQTTEQPKTVTPAPPAGGAGQAVANLPKQDLIGKPLYGSNGTDLGPVKDVVTGPNGQIQSALVRVGQFLGFGGKTVAVPADKLELRGNRIVSTMTADQVRDLPPVK